MLKRIMTLMRFIFFWQTENNIENTRKIKPLVMNEM